MRTPVYIKMDAPDQLLLSEGVCRQLEIIEYHKDVQKWRGGRKQAAEARVSEAKVPTVRVKLVQSLRLSPRQSAVVQVRVDGCGGGGPVYVEHDPHLEDETGLSTEDALLQPNEEGCARMVISNPSSYPQVAEIGTTIGEVIAAAVVEAEVLPDLNDDQSWLSEVRRVSDGEDAHQRKRKLREMVPEPRLLVRVLLCKSV